ncbi:pilus assembly protein TadG-related protein [Arsenicicoccus sp. oral taxon 190]|uniref:pilus assembly protein TadG-related protein n=1 Tax=Arsenicicoccus sp. oral taxon 190 TaxID=1658671 RepID=UPI0012E17D8A|nr:pilus assembly protein TadG-related protein [Arsenicicoccus sp. oral taxon 190]
MGLTVVAGMLVVVGIDVTAVQLARTQLWDAADSAALDAADRVDEDRVYAEGLHERVPVARAGVAEIAGRHLAEERRPHLVRSWSLGSRTGSPDGESAVVEVVGRVDLPIVGGVAEAFGGGVTVTVVSRARSQVR